MKSELRLGLANANARHGETKVQLEELKRTLETSLAGYDPADRASGHPGSQVWPSPQLIELVNQLIDADEVDLLPRFVALAGYERRQLVRFIRAEWFFPKRTPLLERLWELAPLVLAEDLDPKKLGHESGQLLQALLRTKAVGQRFSFVRELLEDPGLIPFDGVLEERSRLAEAGLERKDLLVIRTALVVWHTDAEVRREAARNAPLDSLWVVVVYDKTPLAALWTIAQRMASDASNDLKKIFFDVIKERLNKALLEVDCARDFELLRQFIASFYYCSFFVEDRYFEDLEALLFMFINQAKRFGIRVGDFKHRRLHLVRAREKQGRPRAADPKGIERLPLAIQRHLARAGCYLRTFAQHSDNRIAREILKYVHGGNVQQLAALPQINRQLLADLLRKKDLFEKRLALMSALSNPRCNVPLAMRYIQRLSRQELASIIHETSTNSEVRKQAALLWSRRQ